MDDSQAESAAAGPPDPDQHFGQLYKEHFQAIYAYVLRRAGAGEASDLVAEVFATAWRRICDLPAPPEDKLWLYGVARRVVLQHDRSRLRRERLHAKLDRSVPVSKPGVPREMSDLELKVLDLIEEMKPDDRELVRLIVWDALTHPEIATILGCSVNAVAIRWHRSLKRLRHDIGAPTGLSDSSTLVVGKPLKEGT